MSEPYLPSHLDAYLERPYTDDNNEPARTPPSKPQRPPTQQERTIAALVALASYATTRLEALGDAEGAAAVKDALAEAIPW